MSMISSCGHSSAGLCRYRFKGSRTCQLPAFVVRPPVADITCFKPSVARGVAGHEVAGAPVPSWARWHRVDMPETFTTAPAPPRNHHDVMCRDASRRYRQMGEWATVPLPGAVLRIPEAGRFVALQTGTGRGQQNCGRTTKPAPLAPAIALPPAGSAFFSLVFFAEAKK